MLKPRGMKRKPQAIDCPFCGERLPDPQLSFAVFSGEGCNGGRCKCGAGFVVDETGKAGGQALMDAQAMACDGDLDRALKLDSNKDYKVKRRAYQSQTGRFADRLQVTSIRQPVVWVLKLNEPEHSREEND
jgi:hypothetical protein